jgi:hypothetical protein
MSLRRSGIGIGSAVLALVLLPSAALAQATRTWVSGVGNDSNPCSRTSPCKTWAGAISKTAQGGEINALDSGGFGAVLITKAITLSGTGVTAGVLVGGTNGITINTSPDTTPPGSPDRDIVTLQGLDINGLGQTAGSPGLIGVSIVHAGAVRLEDDEIYGFSTGGVAFEPTAPTTSGAPVPSLTVENSTIQSNPGDGLLAIPPAGTSIRVLLDNDSFEGNGCGIAAAMIAASFTTSNCGGAGTTSTGRVEIDSANTSVSGNAGAGVQSDGSTAVNQIANDVVEGNGTGLQELSGGKITQVGANSVFGNIANGTPSSIVSTGPVGPAGATGANGKIELVTCKSVKVTKTETKKVHGKKKKVKVKVTEQKCTGKLVSGKVKFTSSGKIVTASLTRNATLYGSGPAVTGQGPTRAMLRLDRELTRGRYRLTLADGAKVVARRTITVS